MAPRPRPIPQVRRKTDQEKYAGPIETAKAKIAGRLPDIVDRMIATALGETKDYIVNPKTGEVVEVPVFSGTQLKAQIYLTDRIVGKPESTKIHELGPEAQAGFSVLLGEAAQAHWQLLEKSDEPEMLEAVVEVREVE